MKFSRRYYILRYSHLSGGFRCSGATDLYRRIQEEERKGKLSMKRSRSLLKVLAFSFVLCFAFFIFAGGKDVYAKGGYDGKTVILHSNDVHGQIDGYAYMTALEKDFESKGAEVIMADVGDFSQGTPYVGDSLGETAVEMMNEAGYDIVTIGNHDFDYDDRQLNKNLQNADFKTICANVLINGKPAANPFYIYETKNGTKIGFFGLDTPETQTKSNPKNLEDVTFLTGQDMYDCAQEQIDTMKKEGADIIVGMTHLGVAPEAVNKGISSTDLYANTKGIDMILDGHSHTVMSKGDKGEPIQQTGSRFENVGVVIIDNEKKQIEDYYLLNTEDLEKDDEVLAKANEIIAKVDQDYSEVIAHSEVELLGDNEQSRFEETNNGDFITDAMMWKVRQDTSLINVDEDHMLVIINGGSIRDRIPAGDVTMMDIHTVLPFGNTLSVIYVTGSELLEVLEASTFCTPESLGGYPQTCGIRFTLDTTVPYDQGEEYPDSTYHAPASIKRVTIDSINGKPFNKDDKYAVITNDFLAAGGDTYYAFKQSDDILDLGVDLDTTVIEYVQNELDGAITREKYGEPRGDQIIIYGDETADPQGSSAADGARDTEDSSNGNSDGSDSEKTAEGSEKTSGTYKTVKGDCLWKIAEQKLGDGSRWTEIYDLNRDSISDPDLIFVGQELVLPAG